MELGEPAGPELGGGPAEESRRARSFVASLLGRDLVNRAARFAAAVVLARALTLEDYGALNVGIAAAGVAVTATSLGLNEIGARDVAVAPDRAGFLASRILAVRLAVLGFISAAAVAAVALISPGDTGIAVATAAMALAMAGSAEWLLRGREQMRDLGNALLIGGATVLTGAAIVALLSGSAVAALSAFALGELATAIAGWRWARLGAQVRPRLEGARSLLVEGRPLALSAIALYVYYANVDTIIIAAARSAAEAGLYTAPYRIFVVLNSVAVFAAFAYLPMTARRSAGGEGQASLGPLLHGLRGLVGYGATVLGISELSGSELLGVVFGDEFRQMGDTFAVLCIAVGWFSVGYPLGYALIARNRNGQFLAGAATGAVVNIALNLALIPAYGAIGAASATAAGFVAASLVWLHLQGVLGRPTAPHLAAMSGLTALAVLALATDTGVEAAGAVSLAVGIACVWPILVERLGSDGNR